MALKLIAKKPAAHSPAGPLGRTTGGVATRELVRKPEPAKPAPPVAERREEGEDMKGMSFRFGRLYRGIIEDLERKLETNKTEVVKKGLQHLRTMFGAHNAEIVLTDRAGKKTTIPVITNGIPH
jgi:hypothetical protein